VNACHVGRFGPFGLPVFANLVHECSSQAFGIELYDSPRTLIARNSFDFPAGVDGCEIRELALGEKLDLSRVVSDDAGVCVQQG